MVKTFDFVNPNLDQIEADLSNVVSFKEPVALSKGGYVCPLTSSIKIKVFGETLYPITPYGDSLVPSGQAACSEEAKQAFDLIQDQFVTYLASPEHVNPTKKKGKPPSKDKIANKFKSFTKMDDLGREAFTFKPNVGIFSKRDNANETVLVNNHREHKRTDDETGELITDYTYDVTSNGHTYTLRIVSGSITGDKYNSTILDVDAKLNHIFLATGNEGAKLVLENIDYLTGMRISRSVKVKYLNYETKSCDSPSEYPADYPLLKDSKLSPKSTIGFGLVLTGLMVVKDEYYPQMILTDLYFINTNKSYTLDEDDEDDDSDEDKDEKGTDTVQRTASVVDTPATGESEEEDEEEDDKATGEIDEEEEEEEDSSDEEE